MIEGEGIKVFLDLRAAGNQIKIQSGCQDFIFLSEVIPGMISRLLSWVNFQSGPLKLGGTIICFFLLPILFRGRRWGPSKLNNLPWGHPVTAQCWPQCWPYGCHMLLHSGLMPDPRRGARLLMSMSSTLPFANGNNDHSICNQMVYFFPLENWI